MIWSAATPQAHRRASGVAVLRRARAPLRTGLAWATVQYELTVRHTMRMPQRPNSKDLAHDGRPCDAVRQNDSGVNCRLKATARARRDAAGAAAAAAEMAASLFGRRVTHVRGVDS